MVIAIDGPAGSGKSVIAKMIADKLGFFLLNSGYFYRAVTYRAIELQINPSDEGTLTQMAATLTFTPETKAFLVDGKDILAYLHSDDVSRLVAIISSHKTLRDILNSKMRHIAESRNLVCEGRDMTTVVFPDAEVKIYLDASVRIRAERRFNQGFSTMSLDEIEKTIHDRDEIDKNKKVGALKIADDALYIDSSDLSLEEVLGKIIRRIEQNNRS